MGTIERDLAECCNGCDSNKVTDRKVCIKHLFGVWRKHIFVV